MKGELYESQESCGETSIPISHVLEEHKVSLCKCNVENFYLLFFLYEVYHMSLWVQALWAQGYGKSNLFPGVIRSYVVAPTLSRLVECDTSLHLISFFFFTSLKLHCRKTLSISNVAILWFVLVHFVNVWFTV